MLKLYGSSIAQLIHIALYPSTVTSGRSDKISSTVPLQRLQKYGTIKNV